MKPNPLPLILAAVLALFALLPDGVVPDLLPDGGEKLVDKPGAWVLWFEEPTERNAAHFLSADIRGLVPQGHFQAAERDYPKSDPALEAWRLKLLDHDACLSVAVDGKGETLPLSDDQTLADLKAFVSGVVGGG